MKIRGAQPLFNPISIGELSLQGLGVALQGYHDYESSKAADFAANAALTGQAATSLPGSPLRHVLSDVTGGLVSPTEDINTQGALAQNQVLGQIAKNKTELAKSVIDARVKLGPQAFKSGPLADEANHLGLDLSGPTGMEDYRSKSLGLNQERTNAYVANSDPNVKIKTAAAEATARAEAENAPDILNKKIQLAGAELSARTSAALAVNSSPAAMNTAYNKGLETGTGAALGRISGTADAYTHMSIPAYQASHKTAFVDRDTLSLVKGGTAGEALLAPDKYQEIPISKLPDLNRDKAALANIDRVTKLIADHPEYFPNTDMANPAARFGLGHAAGISNAMNAPNDPNIKDIQSTITNLNSYLRELNGRSPNATQMAQDSNVLIPNLGGYASRADSLPVALDKLQRLRNNIKGLYGGEDGDAGPSDSDISDGIAGEIATPAPDAFGPSTIVSH